MFHHATYFIPPQHEHRLLGLVLITWLIALSWDFSTLPFDFLLLRLVLLIHFGLFVLWQPFWNRHLASSSFPSVFFPLWN